MHKYSFPDYKEALLLLNGCILMMCYLQASTPCDVELDGKVVVILITNIDANYYYIHKAGN